VEALTIALVVDVTLNWRSSLTGALGAVATLAVIVATFGVALVQFVPLDVLRLVVGILLILFGLKWLKKALLRASDFKALHDEEAIFEERMAEIRARGAQPEARFLPFGVALSYKAVLLEGLEVAFIVITFGSSAATTLAQKSSGIASAALGAACAGLLVILAGALMLNTFGTFWAGEGLGVDWPAADLFLLVLGALYLLASALLVLWLKQVKQRQQKQESFAPVTGNAEIKEAQR